MNRRVRIAISLQNALEPSNHLVAGDYRDLKPAAFLHVGAKSHNALHGAIRHLYAASSRVEGKQRGIGGCGSRSGMLSVGGRHETHEPGEFTSLERCRHWWYIFDG